MTDNHPIIPPPELVQQWYDNMGPDPGPFESFANAAARWGANEQLEQAAKWLNTCALFSEHLTITPPGDALRQAMRPKPPSLKELALEEVGVFEGMGTCNIDIIRRALEALPE